MPEKPACDDCPVRAWRDHTALIDASEVAIGYSLSKRAQHINLRSGGLEDDALERCRHWHRWAEALGLPDEVVIELKDQKATRQLPVKTSTLDY